MSETVTGEPPQIGQDAFAWMAKHPELVWRIQADNNPALMSKVEAMLAGGASPEWILQRGEFFQIPVEVQTVFLNALHWRQKELCKS